jgi:MFS family permease
MVALVGVLLTMNRSLPTHAYRWIILTLVWLTLFMHSLMLQSVPPIMSTLVSEMSMSFTQVGSLMGAATLPSILFLAVLGGYWVDRYGARRVGLAALMCYCVGTLVLALSQTYGVMMVGRFISGSGAALLFVITPVLISQWFQGRELGLGMGIYSIAAPSGTIFAFNVYGWVVGEFGWRMVIWISVFAAWITMVAAFIWLRDAKRPQISGSSANASKSPSLWQQLKETCPKTWLLSLGFFLFAAGVFQVQTIAPAYFEETLDGVNTDLIASLAMVASVLIAPFAGRLMDLTGRKDIPVYVGAIGGAALLLLIPTVGFNPVLTMLLLGFFIAIQQPAMYALPADFVEPQRMGFAFGLMSTTFGAGIFVGSLSVGMLRDAMGHFTGAFFYMALLCLLVAVPAWIISRSLPCSDIDQS